MIKRIAVALLLVATLFAATATPANAVIELNGKGGIKGGGGGTGTVITPSGAPCAEISSFSPTIPTNGVGTYAWVDVKFTVKNCGTGDLGGYVHIWVQPLDDVTLGGGYKEVILNNDVAVGKSLSGEYGFSFPNVDQNYQVVLYVFNDADNAQIAGTFTNVNNTFKKA